MNRPPTHCGLCAQPDPGPWTRAEVETIAGRFWVWLCGRCISRLRREKTK